MDISELKQFVGTEKYYNLSIGIKGTDGIKYLADNAKAYWLFDVVASYQKKLKNISFQLWKITVKDNKAVITCREDSDMPNIVRQVVQYTDFPFEEFEFYCINRIVLLKSEY
jgi:hypothetical protein